MSRWVHVASSTAQHTARGYHSSAPQEMLAEKGREALDLTLPFDERATLERNLNYLVRSLDVSATAN